MTSSLRKLTERPSGFMRWPGNCVRPRLTSAKTSALMEAVVQYAKSRPVFEGYKAARYSKKYLAEHGPELADYRAAKAARQ